MAKPPWEKAGMSRASWYRHGKPTTKPERLTQARLAVLQKTSVRSIQRARRIVRELPKALPKIRAGKLTLGEAEKLLRPPTMKT